MTNAAAAYGGVDLRGRVEALSPHGLIQLLFDELLAAMRQTELCIRNRDRARRSERVSRAVAIINGLESSLDHGKGGAVAENLSRVYRQARAEIVAACRNDDGDRARRATELVAEIAGAWRIIS